MLTDFRSHSPGRSLQSAELLFGSTERSPADFFLDCVPILLALGSDGKFDQPNDEQKKNQGNKKDDLQRAYRLLRKLRIS